MFKYNRNLRHMDGDGSCSTGPCKSDSCSTEKTPEPKTDETTKGSCGSAE